MAAGGNGRGDITHERFRAHVHDALTEFGPKPEPREWDAFAERVFFAGGGFSAGHPGTLLDVLGRANQALGGAPQLICYLAVPPVAFAGLTEALGQHELAGGARVVYEKPFGTSRASFRELDRVVHAVLDEQQVYRIDHFLGKEATQDLHLLRFANGSSATGKRMAASHQGVSLILREPPGPLSGRLPPGANVLSFSLAGDGEIGLSLVAKKPGPALRLDVAHASIPLASLRGADPLPPYVRLIHDILLGDRSLFTRPAGLAAVWDTAEPLLSTPPPVSTYPPGSWGQDKHGTSSHPDAGSSASKPRTRGIGEIIVNTVKCDTPPSHPRTGNR